VTVNTVPVLEVRGLRKSYGPLTAVADVDLQIGSGEVVGLVGKNGAGKSSLIKVVTGAVQADAGTISMSGVPVVFRGPADARRRGLAFVHQELNLIESSSIAENIVLGAGYPRRAGWFVNWRELRERAVELMSTVDIGNLDPSRRISSLTAVQQRQVMIAAALWHDASVLILDEPTAALSEHEVVILHEILRNLSRAGTAVLYVTHRLDEVLALTDRVVVMRDGAVLTEASTRSIDKRRLVAMISGSAASTAPGAARIPKLQSSKLLEVNGISSTHCKQSQSFDVAVGEIVGIAGLVGSGRSELLRAVYGADPRLSGSVTVDGTVVRAATPRASLRAGIALLSEDRRHAGLVTDFSVNRNISFARLRQLRAVPGLPFPSRRRERMLARSMVSDLAIKTHHVNAPVMSLSGGNQQKVLLGRWLATRPRVLLLDEPTLGIDIEAKAEIYELLRRLARDGLGLIVVSSEFTELELLCDRALVLRDGTIVDEVVGSDITESALLHLCFEADGSAG
jgi:ABC-type sugar transport system ATPase subunit